MHLFSGARLSRTQMSEVGVGRAQCNALQRSPPETVTRKANVSGSMFDPLVIFPSGIFGGMLVLLFDLYLWLRVCVCVCGVCE